MLLAHPLFESPMVGRHLPETPAEARAPPVARGDEAHPQRVVHIVVAEEPLPADEGQVLDPVAEPERGAASAPLVQIAHRIGVAEVG